MFLKSPKDTLQSLVNPKFVSPGPTRYNEKSEFAQKNRIVTGSLSGPKQLKEDLSFGMSKRFQNPPTITPGPGDYGYAQFNEKKVSARTLPPKVNKPMQTPNCPSIPNIRNKIGNVLEGRLTQGHLQEEPISNITPVLKAVHPGYSFPRSEYPSRQPIILEEAPVQQSASQLPINDVRWPSQKQQQIAQALRKQNQELKDMREENNRRKRQLLDLVLNNNTMPSLEVLQMRKKFINAPIPGPGFYDYNTNTIEIKNESQPLPAFVSNVRRFIIKDEYPQQGPGRYTNQLNSKTNAYSFGREKKEITNSLPKTQLFGTTESYPSRISKTLKQSIEPFGSGSVRFNNTTNMKHQPQVSQSSTSRKRQPQELQRLRKSISTSATMQSEGNLQSVDVLFHMYGNN